MTDPAASQTGRVPFAGVAEADVQAKARSGDREAILELGRRSSSESLSLLAEIASVSIPPVELVERQKVGVEHQDKELAAHLAFIYQRRSLYAKAALAKRGNTDALTEILGTLETSDGEAFETSLGLLAYTGSAKAVVSSIAPYLLRTGTPYKIRPGDHQWVKGYAEIAADALGRLLPEVHKELKEKNPGDYHLIEPWRAWWKANASAFGSSGAE